MSDHAALSPSKRHRWAACPGSIREEARYPESPSGDAALDGTRTHALLERCINYEWGPQGSPCGEAPCRGLEVTDEHGTYVVDLERAKRVGFAIAYIRDVCGKDNCFGVPVAERRVYPDGLVGRADMSGTVDCQIIGKHVFEIIDYKDGMAPVEAIGNLQLEQYAIGALAALPQPYPETVRMTIIQPKLALRGMQPIMSWDVRVSELLARVDVIKAQAAATDDPDAPLVPGDAQCKYCRARGSCTAIAKKALHEMEMVSTMFGSVNPEPAGVAPVTVAHQAAQKDPTQMTSEQLSQMMDAFPLVELLIKGVKDEVKKRLTAGSKVPGYKMVRGRGSRDWNLSEEEMVKKLTGMGVPKSSIYVSDLVSPSQVEKLSWGSKGEMKTLSQIQIDRLTKEYVITKTGSPTVAPESDPREAIVTNTSDLMGSIAPALGTPVPSFLAPPAVDTRPPWLR